jgi:hypothetical protein
MEESRSRRAKSNHPMSESWKAMSFPGIVHTGTRKNKIAKTSVRVVRSHFRSDLRRLWRMLVRMEKR